MTKRTIVFAIAMVPALSCADARETRNAEILAGHSHIGVPVVIDIPYRDRFYKPATVSGPHSWENDVRRRELKMEKGQLRDRLESIPAHGIGAYGRARAIESQIHDLDRQIELLGR